MTAATATKFYAYVKRSNSDWGANLKATTERAAKAEARKLFADDYRDATIYLCEWFDGVKLPVASVPVSGGKWAAIK
jgi:hypothetical protein